MQTDTIEEKYEVHYGSTRSKRVKTFTDSNAADDFFKAVEKSYDVEVFKKTVRVITTITKLA